MLPYGRGLIYYPHSFLSYHLCFEPHVIISRYALTIKQTTKDDFQKRISYTNIILNDQAIFEIFFKFLLVLETKLEMMETII